MSHLNLVLPAPSITKMLDKHGHIKTLPIEEQGHSALLRGNKNSDDSEEDNINHTTTLVMARNDTIPAISYTPNIETMPISREESSR